MTKKFYLTTPVYYTNRAPHVGTAYTNVAADVLARYHRQKDEKVFFLTGTDEHGEKIAQAAKEVDKLPREFVDKISDEFKKTWSVLNISYDKFIRTTDKEHEEGVRKFIFQLKEKGVIYQDKYQALYCPNCEDFVQKKDLIDGKCPYHGKEPELVSETNYFFKLDKFLGPVKELIEKDEIEIRPGERKREVLSMINQDLGNLSISREKVSWGISLPFDEKQTVYVWVDALLNYITAIGYGKDESNFNQYWPADLHLIGKDILKFHAIYWPALLLATGLKPPKKIFIHGFLTINGQKISKSLGNTIDPIELSEKYGVDTVRYFLLREISFGQDGDFSIKRLGERHNADLANGLGNLVSRVLTLSERIKPEEKTRGELTPKIDKAKKDYQKAIEGIKFSEALEAAWRLIGDCDNFVEKNKPWKLDKDSEQFKDVVSEILTAVKEIALLLKPFMPETAEKILKQIKENKKAEALFPRL